MTRKIVGILQLMARASWPKLIQKLLTMLDDRSSIVCISKPTGLLEPERGYENERESGNGYSF